MKIVFITGVFDLFHFGHICLFRKAKELGDYLLVGVHTDEAVVNYKYKKPILTEKERLEVVSSCYYVNGAILIPEQTTLTKDFYEEWSIELQVQGDEFDDYSLPKELGIFKLLPECKIFSTTEILKRIKERL